MHREDGTPRGELERQRQQQLLSIFTQDEAWKLTWLAQHFRAHPEEVRPPLDKRLDFVRWLYRKGRLSEYQ